MNPESENKSALPLEELELAPQWVKAPAKSFSGHTGEDRDDRRRGRRDRPSGEFRERDRDRRPPAPRPSGQSPLRDRPPRRPDNRRPSPPPPQRPQHAPPPLPVAPVEVAFYPEDKGFASMLEAMKQSPRAYALFDVAKLVLNKPERHVVRLSRQPAADKTPAPLFLVIADEQPHLSQDDALRFVFRRRADRVFKETKVPIDPPKGNFTYVNRCGLTGELLGPPNYHGYQTLLVRHHQQRLRHMSFDQFKSRVQTVKDEAIVQSWLESMSFKTEYECLCCATATQPAVPVPPAIVEAAVPSGTPEALTEQASPPPPSTNTEPVAPPAAPVTFASRVELEKHFIEQHLAQFITATAELRLSGTASRRIEHGGIAEAVREAWENERRFPLNTANGLRGRLRQEGFHSFKHNKGITYISFIRRKHFESLDGLTERIRQIVIFLRTHPDCRRKKLFDHFLAPPPVIAPSPVVEAVVTAAVVGDGASVTDAATPAPATALSSHTADQLLTDLHWLIQDGYVVEFSDGRLWALPDLPPPPAPTLKPAPTSAVAAVPVAADTSLAAPVAETVTEDVGHS